MSLICSFVGEELSWLSQKTYIQEDGANTVGTCSVLHLQEEEMRKQLTVLDASQLLSRHWPVLQL